MARQLNLGSVDDELYSRFELVKANLCSVSKAMIKTSKGFEFLLCCAEIELGIFKEENAVTFKGVPYDFKDDSELPEYDGEDTGLLP